MRLVDRTLSILLLLGSIGHTLGVRKFYRDQPHALFWALSATVLMLLLAAIQLLRTWRAGDVGLAWVAAFGAAAYLVVIVGFGRLIGNMADPRVLLFGVISLGLLAFSLIGALGKAARE